MALSAFDSFCRRAVCGQFPQLDDRDNLWRLLVIITARKAYKLILRTTSQKRGSHAVLDEAALAKNGKNVVQIEQFIAQEPTAEFAAQAAEEYQYLLKRLGDDRLREVALLKMEGFTNEEIAAKRGCVERTVYRQLALIRTLWSEVGP